MNSVTFQESVLDKLGLATLMVLGAVTVISQIALMFQ